MKKVFWIESKGFYLGATTIVVADGPVEALQLAGDKLKENGLKLGSGTDYKIKEIPIDKDAALILFNGDY